MKGTEHDNDRRGVPVQYCSKRSKLMTKMIDDPVIADGIFEIHQAMLELEEKSNWPVEPISPAELEELKTRLKLRLLLCKSVNRVWDTPGKPVVHCHIGRVNFMSPGKIVDINILPEVKYDEAQ